MDRFVKIPASVIVADHALPFPVFDVDHNLLAQKSQSLTDIQVAKLMYHKELFTLDKELIVALMQADKVEPRKIPKKEKSRAYKMQSPFAMIDGVCRELHSLLEEASGSDFCAAIYRLAERISFVGRDNTEVALASVFLPNQSVDFVRHSVNVAILSDLVAAQLNLEEKDRHLLIAAALTMDIAHRETHADEKNHSQLGKQALIKRGVIEKEWLDIVSKHHEYNDGTGYPLGLTCDEIPLGASIISLLDAYCEMFTGNLVVNVNTSSLFNRMHGFFEDDDSRFKGVLKNVLLKVTGYYPPGLVVKLRSKEVAVVVRRGKNPGMVQVRCITNNRGEPVSAAALRHTENALHAVGSIMPTSLVKFNIEYPRLWGYASKSSESITE